MKLGLISDTHDHVVHIRKAMALFHRLGVERIVHAGDYGSPASVFAMEGINVWGVLGNNDGEIKGLERAFDRIGGILFGTVGEFSFSGGKGAIYHGTLSAVREALIYSGRYGLVILGHTHVPRDQWIGNTRVLNPGTAHGFDKEATVMVLDETDGRAEMFRL
ncbi:MAG: YfcE family phosphodiesterase [Magnetococcales bacterium]|nr:YfcE family phosphodiesterase [Magnetococcales bacterium]MBF0151912.1 YfcE family phosphodiesterase [Magnetococcales bacterium]MBF0174810.1 YfcE family phosphodiesterase [Magnetococcales bacterium]MBF0349193.1 YfcE family phosphodiesterase [Magnetococcales bacterium]MBF0630444.1 YfcE family phosphodiesterase [Magnetococcales bacterium]